MSIGISALNDRREDLSFSWSFSRIKQLIQKVVEVSFKILVYLSSFLYQKACGCYQFASAFLSRMQKISPLQKYQRMPSGGAEFIQKAVDLYRQQLSVKELKEFNEELELQLDVYFNLAYITAKAFVLNSKLSTFPAYFLPREGSNEEIRNQALGFLWASRERVSEFSQEEQIALLDCSFATSASSLAERMASVQENLLTYSSHLFRDQDFVSGLKSLR